MVEIQLLKIPVREIVRSSDFYRDLCGAVPLAVGSSYGLLLLDNLLLFLSPVSHLLCPIELAIPHASPAILEHRFFDWAARGVAIVQRVKHEPANGLSCLFSDPDGNQLRLFAWTERAEGAGASASAVRQPSALISNAAVPDTVAKVEHALAVEQLDEAALRGLAIRVHNELRRRIGPRPRGAQKLRRWGPLH